MDKIYYGYLGRKFNIIGQEIDEEEKIVIGDEIKGNVNMPYIDKSYYILDSFICILYNVYFRI